MNTYSKPSNLLIVGSGVWATKVKESIRRQELAAKIDHISAHEFLLSPWIGYRDYDCVWIATRPKIQISILKKYRFGTAQKIILEKPVASSRSDFDEFIEVSTELLDQIRFSQPWTYDSRASRIAETCIKPEVIESIDIVRKGPIIREYLDPWLDWAPHDLYLLARHLNFQRSNLKVVSRASESRSTKLVLGNNSGLKISIEAGHDLNRKASWKIETSEGQISQIDLLTGPMNASEETPMDSIGKMYLDFSSDKAPIDNLNQILWQSNLYESASDF